jgi:hypothetical protein
MEGRSIEIRTSSKKVISLIVFRKKFSSQRLVDIFAFVFTVLNSVPVLDPMYLKFSIFSVAINSFTEFLNFLLVFNI